MAETGWPKWMDNFDKWRSADGNGIGGAIREGAKNFFAGWRSGGTVAGQPAGAGGDIGYMMSQWAPRPLLVKTTGDLRPSPLRRRRVASPAEDLAQFTRPWAQ